jgi:hypothetical protein
VLEEREPPERDDDEDDDVPDERDDEELDERPRDCDWPRPPPPPRCGRFCSSCTGAADGVT